MPPYRLHMQETTVNLSRSEHYWDSVTLMLEMDTPPVLLEQLQVRAGPDP